MTGPARIAAVVLLGLAFGGFGWVIGDSTAPSDRDAAAAGEESSREAFAVARLDGSESARSGAYAGALAGRWRAPGPGPGLAGRVQGGGEGGDSGAAAFG